MSIKIKNIQGELDSIIGNVLSFDFGEKRIGVAIGKIGRASCRERV